MTGRIPTHRLHRDRTVEVARFEGAAVRSGGAHEAHRHDYHELLWVRRGSGRHLIDGRTVPVRPQTVTLIGRGQVHLFERGDDLDGAALRFGEELLLGPSAERLLPGGLLVGAGGRTVAVPPEGAAHLEGALTALQAEVERPACRIRTELERHLISVVLLWIEAWCERPQGVEASPAGDEEVQLHGRFVAQLERDFARHHDAAHYVDALAVAPRALARALSQVTGRSTKELILDRVMLEAARLLRFTDLNVGQVAHEVGFADGLYFSRAFKRHAGEAPASYRERVRGRVVEKSMS